MLDKVKPQAAVLNCAVWAALAAVVLSPSWPVLVALVAILGALCFRWTVEPSGVGEGKALKEVRAEMQTLHARVRNLAVKTGLKEL